MVDTNATAAKANETMNQGIETTREYTERARDYIGRARESARHFGEGGLDVAGRLSDDLEEFVREEPWLAIGAAFAVGYVMARLLRVPV